MNKNKKIKIAYFVGSMNCGGTETMLMNLFRKLDKDNYDVTFIENVPEKTWYTDEINKLGGRVIKVQSFSFKNIFSYIKELIELFKKENFDVVHSHVFLHSGIVMYAAYKAGIKIRISHSHSAMRKEDNSGLKVFLLRKMLLKYSTNILACSKEAGIYLFGDVFNKKGKVVPNPINLDLIKSVRKEHVEELRKKYNIKNDEIVLGHVGRLVKVKNHLFLIKLAQKLKENNIKFKMLFVGDGEEKESIENEIAKNNLQEYVILTGNVRNEEVYSYMKLFDILLLPSFYEGLPVTLIEAQASNVFSIVSDNVSRESDLGLGLIEFKNIDKIDIWYDLICSFKHRDILQKDIDSVIINKKFGIDSSVIEYESLYK